MREIRIKRRGMEKRFNQATGESFCKLIGDAGSSGDVDDISSVSVETLSLLQNDVLEENVAFSAMSSRAIERVATPLMQLNTRINTILGTQLSDLESCPLGPTVVCRSMSEALQIVDLEITSKLILLKLFEQGVLDQLDKVIQVANAYLIELGVLPDFTGVVAPVAKKASSQSRASSSKSIDMLNELESGEEDRAVLDLLHDLINGKQTSALTSFDTAQREINSGITLSSSNLLALLSNVQNNRQLGPKGLVARHNAADMLSQLNEMLAGNAGDSGTSESIGKPDQDMIQLVSMLFDVVLSDRNLADAMKVLIGRLQIPMIRIALLDETFFTRKNHPARRLLNEIATSTIGWTESVDQAADALYQKIEDVVDRIVNEFDDDAALIDSILQDFIEFVSVDQQRSERVEKRTREAERGRARKEHARFLVQEVINQYAVGKQLPDFIVSFLRNAWSNRMFLVLLKEGKESSAWSEVQETVETLVWSVLGNHAGGRDELFQRLPGLLAQLETGLTEISFNPSERDEFFSKLEEIHLNFGRVTEVSQAAMPAPTPKTLSEIEPPNQAPEELVLDEPIDFDIQRMSEMGVEEVSMSADEMEALLLNSAQKNEIPVLTDANMIDIDLGQPRSEFATPAPTPKQQVSELKDKPESDIANNYLKRIDAMETGQWVNFSREGSSAFRCKLVAILQPSGQYIFVNRNGVKVEERISSDLAAMLHSGELEILDDSQLFDRALESVIVGLRARNDGL